MPYEGATSPRTKYFNKKPIISPIKGRGKSPALNANKINVIKEEKAGKDESPKKIVSPPKVKKPPSKYMLEIIRLNFVNMIHKYDMHQKRKRMEALKKTRKLLRRRFMKVYRMYRFKKYGEPYDDKQTTWTFDGSDFGDLSKHIPSPIIEKEKIIYKRIEELN